MILAAFSTSVISCFSDSFQVCFLPLFSEVLHNEIEKHGFFPYLLSLLSYFTCFCWKYQCVLLPCLHNYCPWAEELACKALYEDVNICTDKVNAGLSNTDALKHVKTPLLYEAVCSETHHRASVDLWRWTQTSSQYRRWHKNSLCSPDLLNFPVMCKLESLLHLSEEGIFIS